jgi:hypothetical protein
MPPENELSPYPEQGYVRHVADADEERRNDALLKRAQEAIDAAREIVADPEVLAQVSILRAGTGLIGRCAWCGRYRVGDRWLVVEPKPQDLENKTSHGICEDCEANLRRVGMSV